MPSRRTAGPVIGAGPTTNARPASSLDSTLLSPKRRVWMECVVISNCGWLARAFARRGSTSK